MKMIQHQQLLIINRDLQGKLNENFICENKQYFSSTNPWQIKEVQRILGRAPEGKFFHSGKKKSTSLFIYSFVFFLEENETLHNEKLLKLAFNISELTFLKAKQQIIEERLQLATRRNESHAVIEVRQLLLLLY